METKIPEVRLVSSINAIYIVVLLTKVLKIKDLSGFNASCLQNIVEKVSDT